MSTRASLLLLALLPACDLEGNETCETPSQTGPGLTGSASYVLGDGSRMDSDLDMGGFARTSSGSITISADFVDAWSRKRSFDLHAGRLSVGTFDLAGRGDICLPRMTGGADVCSPLTGTIEVRALDEDCYWHDSGIGACAETMDFTIHAESAWETTLIMLDGEMFTIGTWVEEEC